MGKFEFSDRSKKALKSCHKDLQKIARSALRKSNIDFAIISGYRGEEEQNELFANGFSKLKFPASKHNEFPSQAFDFAPYVDGKMIFDDTKYYYYIAGIIQAAAEELLYDIRWGGNWDSDATFSDQRFNDLGHIELKSEHYK